MKDTTRGVTEEDARRGPEGAQGGESASAVVICLALTHNKHSN